MTPPSSTQPPPGLERLRALRAGLVFGAGLACLLWPSSNVLDFIRGAAVWLAVDSLLAALAAASCPGAERRKSGLEALWSLVMALALVRQPGYSILTLSFVLLLQLIVWLTGAGALRLGRWAAGEGGRQGLAGALAMAGALALHLAPGAGAVDRRLGLGLLALAYGGLLLFPGWQAGAAGSGDR